MERLTSCCPPHSHVLLYFLSVGLFSLLSLCFPFCHWGIHTLCTSFTHFPFTLTAFLPLWPLLRVASAHVTRPIRQHGLAIIAAEPQQVYQQTRLRFSEGKAQKSLWLVCTIFSQPPYLKNQSSHIFRTLCQILACNLSDGGVLLTISSEFLEAVDLLFGSG